MQKQVQSPIKVYSSEYSNRIIRLLIETADARFAKTIRVPTGEQDALSARPEYGGRAGEIWRISEEMVMSDELDTYCVLRSDRDLSPE